MNVVLPRLDEAGSKFLVPTRILTPQFSWLWLRATFRMHGRSLHSDLKIQPPWTQLLLSCGVEPSWCNRGNLGSRRLPRLLQGALTKVLGGRLPLQKSPFCQAMPSSAASEWWSPPTKEVQKRPRRQWLLTSTSENNKKRSQRFLSKVVVSSFNLFLNIFIPTWGRWSHFDDHIFHMGWFNHQPVSNVLFFYRQVARVRE